ncbi:hypothetical protein BJ912DRAFT_557713 [Pholiota molesta]|nr:hypothetical protein BJ912DRAFT_557713 [Pholiota molesta]
MYVVRSCRCSAVASHLDLMFWTCCVLALCLPPWLVITSVHYMLPSLNSEGNLGEPTNVDRHDISTACLCLRPRRQTWLSSASGTLCLEHASKVVSILRTKGPVSAFFLLDS